MPVEERNSSVPCPSCGTASLHAFRALDFNRRLAAHEFAYFRCPRCSTLFLEPIPENLGDFYPPEYYTIPASAGQLAEEAEPERYKIAVLERFARKGRLLEIGPATGAFAYLASMSGFDVEVIEMDAACCQFIRRTLGITALHSDDPVAVLGRASVYDAIALWHVLEHVPDPWRLFEAATAQLSPGGVLIIAAPNPNALQLSLFGRYWTHLDAPRHVRLIPLELLEERGRSLGLEVAWTTTADPGALMWNRFGWQHSLRNRYGAARVGMGLDIMGRLAELAAAPLERRGRRGSTYTIVLRKAA